MAFKFVDDDALGLEFGIGTPMPKLGDYEDVGETAKAAINNLTPSMINIPGNIGSYLGAMSATAPASNTMPYGLGSEELRKQVDHDAKVRVANAEIDLYTANLADYQRQADEIKHIYTSEPMKEYVNAQMEKGVHPARIKANIEISLAQQARDGASYKMLQKFAGYNEEYQWAKANDMLIKANIGVLGNTEEEVIKAIINRDDMTQAQRAKYGISNLRFENDMTGNAGSIVEYDNVKDPVEWEVKRIAEGAYSDMINNGVRPTYALQRMSRYINSMINMRSYFADTAAWLGGWEEARAYADKARAYAQFSDEDYLTYTGKDKLSFWDKVSDGLGTSTVFMLPGAVVGVGGAAVGAFSAKAAAIYGITTSTAMESLTEAGQAHEAVLKATGSEWEAAKAASVTFALNAGLNGITNSIGWLGGDKAIRAYARGLGWANKSALKLGAYALAARAAAGGLSEGIQETAQEVIQLRALDTPWHRINMAELISEVGISSAFTGAITGNVAGLIWGGGLRNNLAGAGERIKVGIDIEDMRSELRGKLTGEIDETERDAILPLWEAFALRNYTRTGEKPAAFVKRVLGEVQKQNGTTPDWNSFSFAMAKEAAKSDPVVGGVASVSSVQEVVEPIDEAGQEIPEISGLEFATGTRNLDLGGGNTDRLTAGFASRGVENLSFDGMSRSTDENLATIQLIRENPVDTVTVRGVVSDYAMAARQAAGALKPDGVAYFKKTASPGQLEALQGVFNSVESSNGFYVAKGVVDDVTSMWNESDEVLRQALDSNMLLFQRAFASSPARNIKKYDLDYILSGEGALVYGWGFYFAQNPETAGYYLHSLSNERTFANGKEITEGALVDWGDVLGLPGLMKPSKNWTNASVRDALYRAINEAESGVGRYTDEQITAALETFESAMRQSVYTGQTYQFDVAEDEELLNQELSLAKQPQSIQDKLARIPYLNEILTGAGYGEYMGEADYTIVTGADLVEALEAYARENGAEERRGAQRQASETLMSVGIVGSKYLDQMSRNDDIEGKTYNFVIWDTSRIRIDDRHTRDKTVNGETGMGKDTLSYKPGVGIDNVWGLRRWGALLPRRKVISANVNGNIVRDFKTLDKGYIDTAAGRFGRNTPEFIAVSNLVTHGYADTVTELTMAARGKYVLDEQKELLRQALDLVKSGSVSFGYTGKIPSYTTRVINGDAFLEDHDSDIQEVLRRVARDNRLYWNAAQPMKEYYAMLADAVGSPEAASNLLKVHGIDGYKSLTADTVVYNPGDFHRDYAYMLWDNEHIPEADIINTQAPVVPVKDTALYQRRQTISSAKTSLNQIPAGFKKGIPWVEGQTNIDIGGGYFDTATDYLKTSKGVDSRVFDPFNRNLAHNSAIVADIKGGNLADTATIMNVLNVIQEPEFRSKAIAEAALSIKPDGAVYIQVYEGNGSGVGAISLTSNGEAQSWQNNMKLKDYMPEVEEYFNDVKRKGSLIIAKSPKPGLSINEVFSYLGEEVAERDRAKPKNQTVGEILEAQQQDKTLYQKVSRATQGQLSLFGAEDGTPSANDVKAPAAEGRGDEYQSPVRSLLYSLAEDYKVNVLAMESDRGIYDKLVGKVGLRTINDEFLVGGLPIPETENGSVGAKSIPVISSVVENKGYASNPAIIKDNLKTIEGRARALSRLMGKPMETWNEYDVDVWGTWENDITDDPRTWWLSADIAKPYIDEYKRLNRDFSNFERDEPDTWKVFPELAQLGILVEQYQTEEERLAELDDPRSDEYFNMKMAVQNQAEAIVEDLSDKYTERDVQLPANLDEFRARVEAFDFFETMIIDADEVLPEVDEYEIEGATEGNGDVLFQTAGIRSILDNKEKLYNHYDANMMMFAGYSNQEILDATGWYWDDIDKEMKITIPDNLEWIKMPKPLKTKPVAKTLGEVYLNPELYSAYPFLRDMAIEFRSNILKDNIGGYFDVVNDKIVIYNDISSEAAQRSAIVHEVQHAIQAFEGRVFSDNTSVSRQMTMRELQAYKRGRQEILLENIAAAESELSEAKKRLDENPTRGRTDNYNLALDSLREQERRLVEFTKIANGMIIPDVDMLDNYLRQYNEIEARITESRALLSDGEQRTTIPSLKEDRFDFRIPAYLEIRPAGRAADAWIALNAPERWKYELEYAEARTKQNEAIIDMILNQKEEVRNGGTLFKANEDYRAYVALCQTADRSTFLHESGHIFFVDFVRFMESGVANSREKADYATLRKWMGLAEGQEINTVAHERFARGFEEWLMTGKSPSPNLDGTFRMFGGWLKEIYGEHVADLDVILSDDVQGVYKRLFEIDTEIYGDQVRTGQDDDDDKEVAQSGELADEMPEYNPDEETQITEDEINELEDELMADTEARAADQLIDEYLESDVNEAWFGELMTEYNAGVDELDEYTREEDYVEQQATPASEFKRLMKMLRKTRLSLPYLRQNFGREVATELVRKYPGLFTNKRPGDDTLYEQLNEQGFAGSFGVYDDTREFDYNALIELLINPPATPAPLMASVAVTEGTYFAMLDRWSTQSVQSYLTKRQALIKKTILTEQANYDALKADENSDVVEFQRSGAKLAELKTEQAYIKQRLNELKTKPVKTEGKPVDNGEVIQVAEIGAVNWIQLTMGEAMAKVDASHTIKNLVDEYTAYTEALKMVERDTEAAYKAGSRAEAIESKVKIKALKKTWQDRTNARIEKLKARLDARKAVLAERELVRNIIRRLDVATRGNIDYDYKIKIAEIISPYEFEKGQRRLYRGTDVTWQDIRDEYKKYLSETPLDRTSQYLTEDMAKADKKYLEALTVNDLINMDEQVKELRKQGRNAYNLKQAVLQEEADKTVRTLVDTLKAAKINGRGKANTATERLGAWLRGDNGKIQNMARQDKQTRGWIQVFLESNTMTRVLDFFDGYKDFKGNFVKTFYQPVNAAEDAMLTGTETRKNNILSYMKELGINRDGLGMVAYSQKIGDITRTYSYDAIMSFWGMWMTPELRGQLAYHNDLNESDYQAIDKILKPEHKKLVLAVMKDYADNTDRLSKAYIEDTNSDFLKLDNYLRTYRQYMEGQEEDEGLQSMLGEMSNLKANQRAAISKGFSKTRKRFYGEKMPFQLGLLQNWQRSVHEQEHFIAYAPVIKKLNRVLHSKGLGNLKEALDDKVGRYGYDVLQRWINTLVNPNFYKTIKGVNSWPGRLARNAAVSGLAFNMLSGLKNFTSLTLYMGYSNPFEIMGSVARFMANPMKFIQQVKQLDPQIASSQYSKLIDELRMIERTGKGGLLANKNMQFGMMFIQMCDMVTRSIGWDSVMRHELKRGATPQQARERAQLATANTQNNAFVKDIPAMMKSNTWLNMMGIFQNQAFKQWGIVTHDLRGAVARRTWGGVLYPLIGWTLATSMMAWLMTGDEPDGEEFMKAWRAAAAGSVPLLGSAIAGQINGWSGGTIIDGIGKNIGAISEGLLEGDAYQVGMNATMAWSAIFQGLPVTALRRAYRAFSETETPGEAAAVFAGFKVEGNKARRAAEAKGQFTLPVGGSIGAALPSSVRF